MQRLCLRAAVAILLISSLLGSATLSVHASDRAHAPTVDGLFVGPVGIAVDTQGNVYVGDSNPQRRIARVVELSPQGTLLRTFGHYQSPPNRPGALSSVHGVAVDTHRNVYVSNDPRPAAPEDSKGRPIQEFSPSGKVLRGWGRYGYTRGRFATTSFMTVDTRGNVYAGDCELNKLVTFSHSGKVLADRYTFGRFGELDCPQGVVVDPHGKIYVVDHRNARIVVLAPHEKPLAAFHLDVGEPGGIAMDQQGDLYLADADHNRVLKLTTQGNILAIYPTTYSPVGVAVDAGGFLYVTAFGDGEVFKYAASGEVVAVFK